jgi:hypothetical protein
MVDADRDEDDEEDQAERQPRDRLQSRDVLRDQDREWIDRGGTVAGPVADAKDADSSDRVEPHASGKDEEHGHERHVLLGHADGRGPRGEEKDSAGDELIGLARETLEEPGDERVDRARPPQDGEGSADQEHEENDVLRGGEAIRNGRECLVPGHALSVDQGFVGSRDDLFPSRFVGLAGELALRKDPGQELGYQHHGEEEHEGVRDAEAALVHGLLRGIGRTRRVGRRRRGH